MEEKTENKFYYIIHLLNGQLMFAEHEGELFEQEEYTLYNVLTLMQTREEKAPTITKATPLYNIKDPFTLKDKAIAFYYPMDSKNKDIYEQAVQKFRADDSNIILSQTMPVGKI